MIRQARAMAGLVGVPAAVHVGKVEHADRLPHTRRLQEFADRPCALDLDAEYVGAMREKHADVLGLGDRPFEEILIDRFPMRRAVGREVGQVHQKLAAQVGTVGMDREQLHPARIDADQCLARRRR